MESKYAPFPIRLQPREFGLEETLITVNGRSVAVYRQPQQPSGTPAVFFHGVNMNWSTWTPLLQAADQSGVDRSSWVFLDLPGFGRSSQLEPHDGLATIEKLLLNVFGEIGLQHPNVVGHSMGGFLALDMVARYPEFASAVIPISGTYSTVVDLVNDPIRTLIRAPRSAAAYLPLAITARLGVKRIPQLPDTPLARSALNVALSSIFYKPSALDSSVIAALFSDYDHASFTIAQTTGQNYDVKDTWRSIRTPLSAIFGSRDAIVPRSDAELLQSQCAHAQSYTLERTGHFAHIERPFDVLDRLMATLHP